LPTSIKIPMNENSSGFFVFPDVALALKSGKNKKSFKVHFAPWDFSCSRGHHRDHVVIPWEYRISNVELRISNGFIVRILVAAGVITGITK